MLLHIEPMGKRREWIHVEIKTRVIQDPECIIRTNAECEFIQTDEIDHEFYLNNDKRHFNKSNLPELKGNDNDDE